MGFFDWFFRRQSAALPPEELRERLLDAVHFGDTTTLAQLCVAHEATILEHFSSWRRHPEGIAAARARLSLRNTLS